MLIFFAIFLAFSLNSCNCLTLPKIFNGGIVLQAEPTGAMIWGFLDGDTTNEVQLKSSCYGPEIFPNPMSFFPKEVNISYNIKYQYLPFYSEMIDIFLLQDDYLFEFAINFPQNEVCDFQILQGDTVRFSFL